MSGDRILGAAFALVAGGFIVSARALPAGLANVPGAGFFPFWIGLAMLGLSIPLLFRNTGATEKAEGWRQAAAVAGLTLVYLLLWGQGFFALRTFIFLAVLLRLLGESWRAGATVSATLTAAVVVAFQYGLRVSLE